MRPLAFLAFVFLSLPAFGQTYLEELRASARTQGLGEDREWLRLLHMKRRWPRGWKSEADDKKFFLAPKGKTDPQAELEATLTAFFAPVSLSTEAIHPQSQFPARYLWLKERLTFDPQRLPEVESPRFRAWKEKMNFDGASLIFASAYLNNPASMFGHTFLRLHRPGHEALLDYTANFAAVTDDQSGIHFAVKGLLGGYPGRFATTPYYMKVQQYNNMEHRELWEYDLRLTTGQARRMRDHLWELGSTEFAYFFLTENCSYQLLPLLEVADFSQNLSDRFRFKAIPVDTMRAVSESGMVGARRTRPARMQLVFARRGLLSPAERRWVERRADSPQDLAELPADRRALALDSAYDLFRLRRKFRRYGEAADEVFEAALLRERSAQDVSPVISTASLNLVAPEAGHPTGSVGLSGGTGRGYVFEELDLRASLHDLADPPAGYPAGSQLNMVRLKLRYHNQAGRLNVEQGTLVDIVSLFPWDPWTRTPSWKFFLGWERARDLERPPHQGTHFTANGGSGLSFKVPGGLLFARGEADAGIGGIFEENARLGAGAAGGFLFAQSGRWRTYGEAGWRRYFWGDVRNATRLSWIHNVSLNKLWTLRAEISRVNESQEFMAGFSRFL